MKYKKTLFVVSILLILIFTNCTLSRFVIYNFADIDDYKIFPSRTIKNKSDKTYTFSSGKEIPFGANFDTNLEKNETVAFLVIQNDSLKYERYFDGFDKTSMGTSFSMAKTFTSILIGCAIDDGFIKSVDEPILKYLPELKDNGFEDVTIEHLLQMTSGLDFNESYYNPFGHAASFYYGNNLTKSVSKLKLKQKPGVSCEYVSGNSQLLGMVLQSALKETKISTYFQNKLWTPLEMEYDATWSLDKKDGVEKTFCCVNARARDFAKIGRLYLNKGNWNGKQIVSKKWVEKSTKYEAFNGNGSWYQYQWWIPNAHGDFMAQGILGQFIYVCPSKNLIIVRLGKDYGKTNWTSTFMKIKEKL